MQYLFKQYFFEANAVRLKSRDTLRAIVKDHSGGVTMTTMTTVPTVGFLRLPQILQLVPISKSAWWEGCKTGRFPKPVKLGPRTIAWKAEDIAALVERLGDKKE